MKQVLLMVGVLLLAMLGYYWVNTKNPIKTVENKTESVKVVDKEVYFGSDDKFTVDQETKVKLMLRDNEDKVVGFWVEFNYDPTMTEIKNVEVNKGIFDKKAEVKIDVTSGNVKIIGQNSKNRDKLAVGEILLANIQIKNLKKGQTMFYLSRKAESDILVKNKVVESYLEMPNFKINIL
ncbi:MAG: hypothetical protein WC784_01515 [Candidatus Shapirobacteria bacterium]|jgi:hypothetical protein